MRQHTEALPSSELQFVKEGTICKSLSGVEVPILTVTSRVNSKTFEQLDDKEFTT